MKTLHLFLPFIFFFITSCYQFEDCTPHINSYPLYGRGKLQKCSAQLLNDKIFLQHIDSGEGRKKACTNLIARGWQYFYKNVYDTALFRFNQAWLCDSTNFEIYWGIGNILGKQKKYRESLIYLFMAIKLDSNITNLWYCCGLSYGQLFFQTKDEKVLDSAIYCHKKAIRINPKNAFAYAELTSNYSYYMQKDSAKKYLKIADGLDSTVVNPEVRKLLNH